MSLEVFKLLQDRPCRFARLDRGGAGGGLSARGSARYLAHAGRRSRHHAAGRPEELPADPAACRSRSRADVRRRPMAGDDAAGAGGAGAGMRAGDLLPDRQAGIGASGAGSTHGSRRPHHRPPHLDASQPQIHEAGGCRCRNRPGHCRGRNGASRDRDHHPEHAILPISLLRNDASNTRHAAVARHCGVRHRPVGERLESDVRRTSS